MKALIVGLLSLTVLAGCATTMKTGKKGDDLDRTPPAATGFCHANDGIFVILLGPDGEAKGFACPGRKNNGPITQPDNLDDHDPRLVKKGPIDLGELTKFAIPGDPDPCYVWEIFGTRYHICW